MKLKKIVSEIFVGVRKYKTYMPDEWNYPLLVKLFDDYFGQDLKDKMDGETIYYTDLDRLLYHYGATHFQSKDINNKPILPRLAKMLKDKGHTILDKNHKPI